ncbi:aromatic acid/H+ symport family MFS transporter [Bradyrhizobium prioriisuperbiae]|uniref:MFS transporter n=1 Tax=Bradyrhizobium prioriisuperbiae TaxID=2854389 RepID=UPI0028E246C0|nr:aromatic acid/H+ symport family MFS transporter [Bradyrhizobium prioritasuperba]
MRASDSVDVQAFLDEQPFSAFQWLVFVLCFAIVLFDGFDTAAIGFIAPSLVKEWGVEKSALGPVLSAALFGLAAGALSTGPLSDRFGRKRMLVASVLVFGAACLGSAFAVDLQQLTILRFVTGIGLGAAMPNAVTLMNEYCPQRRRAMLTNLMFCGFPLGGACGGFLAAWMIPQWGWRNVLVAGGAAPLLLVVLLLPLLPESVRYMVANGQPVELIRKVLSRISPSAATARAFVLTEQVHVEAASGTVGLILSRAFRVGSIMLWLAYFMGLVVLYALANWMPILFKDAGLTPQTATLIAALFPLGGVGAVLFGWLMDRFNANRIIAVGYVLTAVTVFAIGHFADNVGLLVPVVFVAGALANTAQSSMPSLAAGFYPTKGRATGVAWMLGIGRFGGIAGSFLVAELVARHFSFSQIFAIVAIPGAIAALALVVKQAASPQESAEKAADRAVVRVH